MKERIGQIMQYKGLNASQFAEAIGIQRAALSHIMSGRNNPSLDVVSKILDVFKEINPDWILFGKGDMKRVSDKETPPYDKSFDLFTDEEQQKMLEKHDIQESSGQEAKTIEFSPEISTGNIEQDLDSDIKSAKEPNSTEKPIQFNEKQAKSIEKMVVFYSDQTYEIFVPEKN